MGNLMTESSRDRGRGGGDFTDTEGKTESMRVKNRHSDVNETFNVVISSSPKVIQKTLSVF